MFKALDSLASPAASTVHRGDVAIVGAGGHGRETLEVINAIAAANSEQIRFTGFYDDGTTVNDPGQRSVLIEGTIDQLRVGEPFVIAIGNPITRRAISTRIGRLAADPLVHPTVTLGSDIELADGVVIAAQTVLTTNVRLGRHTHCNPRVVVSHDCRVGDYVSLSPGVVLNGNVSIDDDVLVGAGAVILPGVHVGPRAIIGAGAVVVHDVAAGATVAGSPARPLR